MSFSSTPLGQLLKVVFASILEVFLLCLSGYILAGKGILDKKTQKQINRLNVSLFTPALLFSKVAFFLSPAKLQELWIIPIYFTVVTLASMIVAFVLGTICRLKKSQRSFAMAAAMFMNSNSLPIALMQSLVVTVPDLKWDADDNKDIMLGRALTYLVLYSTLGMVVRWSYGVKLLSQADDEIEDATTASMDDERCPLLPPSGGEATSYTHIFPRSPSTGVSEREYSPQKAGVGTQRRRHLRPQRHLTPFYSFPNTPVLSHSELSSDSAFTSEAASDDGSLDDGYDPLHDSGHRRSSLRTFRFRFRSNDLQARGTLTRTLLRSLKAINNFMTAPLWAAAASLLVACIPPLQHALEQHITPVKGAISSAGKCSIPLTLIVLGAYFYPTPSEQDKGNQTFRPNVPLLNRIKSCLSLCPPDDPVTERQHGETRTVIVAVASRMFITPLVLLPLMVVGTRFDLHAVFSDPVFVVSNVLLLSSPPALTLAQITQAASGEAFERLISRTIFWSYCIVTPPMTIAYVVIGLILAKL